MTREELRASIAAIEESYEFFLAYAAQGLTTHEGSAAGGQVQEYLRRSYDAMGVLVEGFREHLPEDGHRKDVLDVLAADAAASRALVGMILGRPAVSSQLIDNLNASIHVRALLTDLFILDEILGA